MISKIKLTNDENIDILHNYKHLFKTEKGFLLNKQTTFFCFLEKIVYDIASIHINRLRNNISTNIKNNETFYLNNEAPYNNLIDLSLNEYNIQFCLTDNNDHIELHNKIYNDYSNYKNRKNILTTSITYFNNDDLIPDIFNFINVEKYKFKKNDDNIILYSFPEKLKHIWFDEEIFLNGSFDPTSNKYSQETDSKRLILYVRIWKDYLPIECNYFKNILTDNSKEYNCNYKLIDNIQRNQSLIINLDEKYHLLNSLFTDEPEKNYHYSYLYNLITRCRDDFDNMRNNFFI